MFWFTSESRLCIIFLPGRTDRKYRNYSWYSNFLTGTCVYSMAMVDSANTVLRGYNMNTASNIYMWFNINEIHTTSNTCNN